MRTAKYSVPLYRVPDDLIVVDLASVYPELSSMRLRGKLQGRRIVPYPSRSEITSSNVLAGQELVWVDDPVDAFFLEIQGSGRVQLDDCEELRLGYAAQNGFPYAAIGRELLRRGALTKEQVSMASIRDWLEAHPQEAGDVMRTNASYIFFRQLTGEGPLGSLGVPLTPQRSLAVDPLFVPLGVPLWLDTTLPAGVPGGARPLRRLVVAQDTGGAINGPVRGDVFWGHGDEAAALAGSMRQPGRLWLLLPRTVALPADLTSIEEPAAPPPASCRRRLAARRGRSRSPRDSLGLHV